MCFLCSVKQVPEANSQGELHSESFVTVGGKWGDSGTFGTSGGTVTWSVGDAGIDDDTGVFFDGLTQSFEDMVDFDYVAVIESAFDAWSAVADIEFVQVADDGLDIGVGDAADIRLVSGSIDGDSGTLAQAFLPNSGGSANQWPANGDIVFDADEVGFWSEESFFLVALHEIGHSLGLTHEGTEVAVMNAYYNGSLDGLQPDDIAGIQEIYGATATSDGGGDTVDGGDDTVDDGEDKDAGGDDTVGGGDDTLGGDDDTLDGDDDPIDDYYVMAGDEVSVDFSDVSFALTVTGNSLENQILGTAFDDVIKPMQGDDTVSGGAGSDFIVGGNGSDLIDAGDGDDEVYAGILDNGHDTLNGGEGHDVLAGGSGTDSLSGDDGNDTLFGGFGADTVEGGSGDDNIWAGAGADSIIGGADFDTLGGGIGSDIIDTGTGNDVAYAAAGADTVIGGDGNDELFGGRDNDQLTGGSGNDLLFGGDGNDTYIFGLNHGDDAVGGFLTRGDNRFDVSQTGLNSFDDLTITENEFGDAVIDTGEGTITVWFTAADEITAADFIF